MPPLVSVILPSYNHAPFLARRIDSILTQTFTDFEVIILDDCSTDGSRQILDRYKCNSKIKHLIYNDLNSGSTFSQWKKGFSLASGKYIWIAESDDYCDADFLQILVEKLEKDTSATLSYCTSIQVDENDYPFNGLKNYYTEFEYGRWDNDYSNDGIDEIRNYLIKKNTIPNASAVVFRKNCMISAIKYISEYRLSGDWLFWILLLKKGSIYYSVSTRNYFRYHTKTVRSSTAGTSLINDERKKILLFLLKIKIINKNILQSLLQEYNKKELNLISRPSLFIKSELGKISLKVKNFKYRARQRIKSILHRNKISKFESLLIEGDNNKKFSYSQMGEDLIVSYLFQFRGIDKPSFIDIGANHPFIFNNTALFYTRGSRGINIEANPVLHHKILKDRIEDINLNIGLSDKEEELSFYIMEEDRLSTFSKSIFEDLISKSCVLKDVIPVKTITLKSVLDRYFNGICPDYMSIDVNDLTLNILKTIDFKMNCPKVICVEAVDYSPTGVGSRKTELIDFLVSRGYYEYANTNLNAIMVKRDFWFI